jgi:hypothetical protein
MTNTKAASLLAAPAPDAGPSWPGWPDISRDGGAGASSAGGAAAYS